MSRGSNVYRETKEKLTKAVAAKQPWPAATGPSCDGGKGFDLDIKSKLGELADETPGSRLGGAVIEVIGAEILIPGAVSEKNQNGKAYLAAAY